MNFVKLKIFCIVYNLFVVSIGGIPQIIHQSNKYTMHNKFLPKPSDEEISNTAANQQAWQQIFPYYLATTIRPSSQLSHAITLFNSTLMPAMFVNNLTTSNIDDSMPNLTGLNPALSPESIFKNKVNRYFSEDITNNDSKTRHKQEGDFCRRSFDGRSGYCILAYQCLHVIREHRVQNMKIDICTFRKNIPVICCTLADKVIDDQRISAQKCQEYHEAVRGINLGLARNFSDKVCTPSTPLIIGGEITQKEEYPHMVALGWTQSDKGLKWKCGGTLISELFVLTAAHCATADRKPPDVVRLGAHNLWHTARGQEDIKILVIILHPEYLPSLYYHDIALLKLSRRVRFSITVQPACLWQLPDLNVPTAVATGWGITEFLSPNSNVLLKVKLNIIDHKTCKNIYGKKVRFPQGISENQLCAGYLEGGKDTCKGDSGGPLHVELPELNCVKFVIGITSFGQSCAAPNAPGVYMKIYPYLDWIEKIVFKD